MSTECEIRPSLPSVSIRIIVIEKQGLQLAEFLLLNQAFTLHLLKFVTQSKYLTLLLHVSLLRLQQLLTDLFQLSALFVLG
jgi:hypothetical protein